MEAVNKFTDELGDALSEEHDSIRETDLSGGGKEINVWLFKDEDTTAFGCYDVIIDQMGRLTIPCGGVFDDVTKVALGEDVNNLREVMRKEPRYENQKQVAWVCYLLPTEGGSNDTDLLGQGA